MSLQKISSPEGLKFLDESKSVNMEARRLVAKEKADTIIVLSHAGYDVDMHIAKNAAPKIGLIVGGHSHTFLFTGKLRFSQHHEQTFLCLTLCHNRL